MTLKELIRYTDVANRKVIAVFEGANKSLPEAEKLFSHVLYSSQIWISRLQGEVPTVDRFDLLPVSEFASFHERVIEDLYQLLEHSDLSAEITYRDSRGNAFTGIISDILFHVVNHSTYHRAQVATQFRLNGLTPPVTDFIWLKRQGEL